MLPSPFSIFAVAWEWGYATIILEGDFPCPMLSELLSKHIAPSRTLLWGWKKRAWYTPLAPDQFPQRVWKVDTMPNFIPSITIVICCARYGGRWQCCHNSSWSISCTAQVSSYVSPAVAPAHWINLYCILTRQPSNSAGSHSCCLSLLVNISANYIS